jgi:hypothetical protein
VAHHVTGLLDDGHHGLGIPIRKGDVISLPECLQGKTTVGKRFILELRIEFSPIAFNLAFIFAGSPVSTVQIACIPLNTVAPF